jgi:hypothetical protein
MDSCYIQGQALTLTKAHEEHSGPLARIAKSMKLYGHDSPAVLYSDDPVKVMPVFHYFLGIIIYCGSKDKPLLYAAFPSLFGNLTPIAAAYGLTALELPPTMTVSWLGTFNLTESTLASIMASVDQDPQTAHCASFDAEWNISRRIGVSIIQLVLHSNPNVIYIIPVCLVRKLLKMFIHYIIGLQIWQ